MGNSRNNKFAFNVLCSIFIALILVSSPLVFAAPEGDKPGKGDSPEGRPFQNLQQQIDDFNFSADQLRLQIDENSDQIALLQAEDVDLQAQIDVIAEEVANFETREAELQDQIDANNDAIADLEAQITANDADIRALRIFDGSLQAQIDSNNADIADLQSQIIANNAAISDLQDLVATNDSDIQVLQLAILSLQSQIDSNDADISSLQEQITSNDADLTSLSSSVADLQAQIDSNDADISSLQEQITSNDAELISLSSSVADLQAQINSNDGDITDLQAQINAKMADITALQIQNNNLQTQVNANDGDNRRLQGEIDAKMADITALQIQNNNLQTQVNANDGDNRRLQGEIEDNDADILLLQRATSTIQTEIVALQLTGDSLQVQLDANDVDNVRLQGEIDDIVDIELVALQLTGDSLQVQLDANDVDNVRLQGEIDAIVDIELVALQLRSDSLQDQIDSNDLEIASLLSQNLTIEKDILNLTGDITDLQELDRVILGLIEGLVDRVTSIFNNLQEQITANDGDIEELQDKTEENMMDIQDIDVSSLERRVTLLENAVSIINTPPTVSAGEDKIVRFVTSQSTSLDGSASDEGILLPLDISWTLESGPSSAVIDDSSSPSTGVTFSNIGTYVFRLSAFDGLVTVFDEATVTVLPNSPPIVDAGVPFSFTDEFGHRYGDGRVLQTASPSNAYLLRGSVTEPDGNLEFIIWHKLSGPGNAIFFPDNSPNTSVEFSASGNYVLKLQAFDGLAFGEDTISFTVIFDNEPPNINGAISSQSEVASTTRFSKTIDGITKIGRSCNFDIPALVDDGPNSLSIQWRASLTGTNWFGTGIDGTETRQRTHVITSGNDPALDTWGQLITGSFRYFIDYTVTANDGFYSQTTTARFFCG